MTADLPIVADPSIPVKVTGVVLLPLRETWKRQPPQWFRETPIPLPSEWRFMQEWKKNKREFLSRGFSLRKENGAWRLQQWLIKDDEGNYRLTEIGAEKLADLQLAHLPIVEPKQPPPPNLPELPADIADKLFPYQIEPARQLFRALMRGEVEYGYPGAWDCSDLGTGKTYQALAAAIALSQQAGMEIAVVCPLAVIPAWKNAFKHFKAVPRFVVNYESLRTGRRDWIDRVKFQDERGRTRQKFEWKIDPDETILLLDEAHNCKTTGSLNQGMLMAAIRRKFKLLLISGTLATDPTHMRATGRVVGLHKGARDYQRFLAEHHCTQTGGPYDWRFMGGKKDRNALAAIHRAVFPNRGARTRIADLGDLFPETQIIAEAFDTGDTQAIAQAFKEAEQKLNEMAKMGASEGLVNSRRQSIYMEAWHKSERAKVPAIVQMVKAEQEAGRSVAVFVNFTDVREALMTELKTRCAIFGGQKPEDRQRQIDAFQRDESRQIIANIDAGGVGVSLHDLNGDHPRTAIILPTNKVVSLTQALGRVHRAGGKSKSRQIVFFAAGTIEEDICNTIRARMANLATLNDGDLNPEAKF